MGIGLRLVFYGLVTVLGIARVKGGNLDLTIARGRLGGAGARLEGYCGERWRLWRMRRWRRATLRGCLWTSRLGWLRR